MRRPDLSRRSLARADVQTAWITSAALLLAVFIPGMFLYAYAATESLEEIDRWFDFVLQVVVREVEERGPAAISLEDVRGRLPNVNAAVRVRAPNGDLLYERGVWPDPKNEVQALSHRVEEKKRNLGSVRLLRRNHWIVGERNAASGARVELALPLRHFASETLEIRRRVVVATTIAAAVILLIGYATTMRAFSPLRRATARLREVDTGSLGVRLPSRRTGDPIDLHAETLNSVLERIDAGFARLRSFSSDVAHELRTPLNRISTVSEVALLAGGERELRGALEAIHGTTEQLGRVVQALLLLAEIDDRRFALRPQRIEVSHGSGSMSRRTRRRSRRRVSSSRSRERESRSTAIVCSSTGSSRTCSTTRSLTRPRTAASRSTPLGAATASRSASTMRVPESRRPIASGSSIVSRVSQASPRRVTGSASRSRAQSRSCTAARCACRDLRSAARASSSGCHTMERVPPPGARLSESRFASERRRLRGAGAGATPP